MRKPARPAPAPTTGTAKRLEYVRTEVARLPSLRSFWARLLEGWEGAASYEAVRSYHFNREPPASYLARVAEVFDMRLEWLVTGQGSPQQTTAAPERADRRAIDEFYSRFPVTVVSPAMLSELNHLGNWLIAVRDGDAVNPPASILFPRLAGEAMAAPLEVFGIDIARVPPGELEEYVSTVAAALRRVLRSMHTPQES